jgi:hypothetical protein
LSPSRLCRHPSLALFAERMSVAPKWPPLIQSVLRTDY